MPLTDTAVRNARAENKPRKLYDSDGLFLLVNPNGSKYWRVRYQFAGKERLFQIGPYPNTTLQQARVKAAWVKAHVKEGRDPVAARRLERAANTARALETFELVARDWIKKNTSRWSKSYTDKLQVTLQANVFPRLGRIAITQLTQPMVLDAVTPIADRGAIEQAYRALRWIGAVFRYAIATGRASSNPIAHIRASEVLPSRRRKNHPHLERAELPGFLRSLTDYPGQPETRIAVNLLLLTFVRTNELRAAKWVEFDLKHREWRIPAARMKMRNEHVVPLARQTLALLEELRGYSGYSEYLFPNHGKHPYMSENTINKAIALLGYKGRVVGHGFRATASTIINESGEFTGDIVERQLAHKEQNEVRAAYHHAQYLPERRRMMQWWADFLDAEWRGVKASSMTSLP